MGCKGVYIKRTCFHDEITQLDLNLSMHDDRVSTKTYDKRDDLSFDIVNFPFLDDDVPQRPSYGVYIFQLIRFARASSHVTDFNNRNKFLTATLLKQGYRYHKLRKACSNGNILCPPMLLICFCSAMRGTLTKNGMT